uniref:Uncharacterized protein n=1 Tax=Oryza sativa subsp. japonica TaxID=39947 RepID=Q6ESM5_ORYSJ|nr:hypothetical protein [Oryza sativa Japonica Group]
MFLEEMVTMAKSSLVTSLRRHCSEGPPGNLGGTKTNLGGLGLLGQEAYTGEGGRGGAGRDKR